MTKVAVIVSVAALLVAGLVIGFVIGFFSRPGDEKAALLSRLVQEGDSDITDRILREINPENIRDNLRMLTEHPHLAGTPADLQQAEYLKNFWEESGLDRAQLYPYDVLLSYPDQNEPNRVVLYDGRGVAVHTSQLVERILRPEQNQSDVVPPFNAYSAAGTPRGDLLYVNYGRLEDFSFLKNQKNTNFRGKICIARYGKIFRGDKASFAETFGCAGLLMYTDPADYAVAGEGDVYPDSWFLPGTGVQRGTLLLSKSDPLTPGYPSIDSAFRIPESEAGLPTIPVHPIGYDDAKAFLQNLAGDVAPAEWQGSIPGLTYKLGPGFADSSWRVQMFISTHSSRRTTYNVMGYIEGAIEPDRYVLLGNHRDAWVFGAVDPSSGTAAMMELSRVFGKLLKEGWRPRRTIVFCSWGAEEYGLVGSMEWVEHFGKVLGDRAVAYLNVDIAVQGNSTFRGRGLPMLHTAMYDVAKKIPNPSESEATAGRPTLYDTWRHQWPQLDESGSPTGRPHIVMLGSGSDHVGFVNTLGVTCADIRYHYDRTLGLSSYPLYHSVYETFHLVETFYDPKFYYHRAVAQYWGELARHLADSLIIPFDVVEYGKAIEQYINDLLRRYDDTMKANGLTQGLDYLDRAVQKFKMATVEFNDRVENVDRANPVAIRAVNDRMMQLERNFIDPLGLPGYPLTRHVVLAPSSKNAYAGSSFPGLTDSLFEIEDVPQAEAQERWSAVRKQLATVTFFIESAVTVLVGPTQI